MLGAVGHSALARLLLGSVSDYVATNAEASASQITAPAGTAKITARHSTISVRSMIEV